MVLVLTRREGLSELIFTVIGIVITALLGYIFKLKKDGRSKDNIINMIARELTGVAKDNAEEKMSASASRNTELTRERIEFLNALDKARHELDGVDEEEGAEGLEKRKPSAEAAEEVGGLTSDPVEAPSGLDKELSDELKELAKGNAERIKKKLEGEDG